MRRAATALALFALGGPSALADAPDLPAVAPGTSIFWVTNFDGDTDQYRERVHKVGSDWILFQSLFEDTYYEDDEALPGQDYFLIFSGIEFYDCSEDKFPSSEEREARAGLFPLETGTSITLGEGEMLRTMMVGEATPFFLMGDDRSAHDLLIEYADDSLSEDLTILDDPAMTVGITWDESSKDRVLAINSTANTPLPELTEQDLGFCAGFLADEEDNQ